MVEIGAGHGRLSFLLAKELRTRHLNGMVICTDFHDTVFLELLCLPWVRLCDEGYLDFSVCSAAVSVSTKVSGLQLMHRGKQRKQEVCTAPIMMGFKLTLWCLYVQE